MTSRGVAHDARARTSRRNRRRETRAGTGTGTVLVAISPPTTMDSFPGVPGAGAVPVIAARSTGSPRALHHLSTEFFELMEKSIEGGGTSPETRRPAPRVVAHEVTKVLGRLPVDGGIRSKARGGRRVASAAIPRVERVHLRAKPTRGGGAVPLPRVVRVHASPSVPLPVPVTVSSTPRRVVERDVAVPAPIRLFVVRIGIEPEPEPERGRSRGTRRGSVRAETGRFRVHRARAPPSRARPRPRPRSRGGRVGSAGDGGDPATHPRNLPTKIAHLHRERVETPRRRA